MLKKKDFDSERSAVLLLLPRCICANIIFFHSDDDESDGVFLFTYLDRGFPLKSAISKALQNLMLSGISGMSAGEKRGGDRSQHHGHTDVEQGGHIIQGVNHFQFLIITTRWSREVRNRKRWKLYHGGRGQSVLLHLHSSPSSKIYRAITHL